MLDIEDLANSFNGYSFVGKCCGCLEILDNGLEYKKKIESKISEIIAEKEEFLLLIQNDKLRKYDWNGCNGNKENIPPAFIYEPRSFQKYHEPIRADDFDVQIELLNNKMKERRYKCKCRKCGKIRYYPYETLMIKPKFCLRPMYCSSRSTNSVKAKNATVRKVQQYQNDESVCFVDDRNEVAPSPDYCDKWNEKRKKELKKRDEKEAAIIAALPREFAKNYDIDYVGTKYESLEIVDCNNDSLEIIPKPSFNQRHQKRYGTVTVFKQYLCRCYLCGKEQIITCDKFGIYPPTQYGARAYHGYWSEVSCDCHKISSFQWIVNDILIKHGVDYIVEYAVDGLLGIDDKTSLRFDFAVFNKGEIVCFIECQGEQHFIPVEEFGGERRFIIQQENDEAKRKYAKEKNITLIEISYKKKKYATIESILKKYKII